MPKKETSYFKELIVERKSLYLRLLSSSLPTGFGDEFFMAS
jgi:hypothetical protein